MMEKVNIEYRMALKLEMYMEDEIKRIKQEFHSLSWKYDETCAYKKDIKQGKRSFSTDYGIEKSYYEDRVRELRIRQYKLYIELENFIKDCKNQNGGKPYLPYSANLKRELIYFNPSYDNVYEELERLTKEEDKTNDCTI